MWRAGVSAAVVVVLSTGGPASAAGGGILITHTITSGRETATHRAHIERTRIRSELMGQSGDSETVVFDRSAQIIRIVDDRAKTYSEIRTSVCRRRRPRDRLRRRGGTDEQRSHRRDSARFSRCAVRGPRRLCQARFSRAARKMTRL
jgi:hypothetical protein